MNLPPPPTPPRRNPAKRVAWIVLACSLVIGVGWVFIARSSSGPTSATGTAGPTVLDTGGKRACDGLASMAFASPKEVRDRVTIVYLNGLHSTNPEIRQNSLTMWEIVTFGGSYSSPEMLRAAEGMLKPCASVYGKT